MIFNLIAQPLLHTGAHSFGEFNLKISYLTYFWTRRQANLLNNQLFRNYASHKSHFSDCGDNKAIGDELGNKVNTTWSVVRLGFSEKGGPFQWMHEYYRCPICTECLKIGSGKHFVYISVPGSRKNLYRITQPFSFMQVSVIL